MAVELSAEQQFEIEKQARTLLTSKDAGPMAAALPAAAAAASR